MFNALMGLGWGVVGFAIIVGVGAVVLAKMSGAYANCGDYQSANATYNYTDETCYNSTDGTVLGDPTSQAWVSNQYMNTQLGTTGLAGWAPAIIAFSVGMLFLGGFLIRKGSKRQY